MIFHYAALFYAGLLSVGLGNGISSVPVAFWKLEEMKKRQMRNNFQRRTLSYDGSSEFSDLHSENDWQLIGGCDDGESNQQSTRIVSYVI